MKRNLSVSFICLCLVALFSIHTANATTLPPKDSSSLVGKVITFRDNQDSSTFSCSVVGVSEPAVPMSRQLTLSIAGLNYRGEKIAEITYLSSFREEGRWQLVYKGNVVEINML